MVSIKELLELRKQIKSKKPNFIRQSIHKKKRLYRKWRRPKGLHSKIRLKLKGRGKSISAGYRGPKKVRFLHKSGLQQCIIRSIGGLGNLDAKKNCLIISSSLGKKKKIVVLKKAKELGFNILNAENPDEYIKKIEDEMNLRREAKKKGSEKKKDVKVKEKKEKLTEKVEEKDQKESEKKEKAKVLTKRDI